MTCGHCVASVTEEVAALAGVQDVQVDLASGRVVVTSAEPLARADVGRGRGGSRLRAGVTAMRNP